jgi:hypothetical protein
MAGVGLFVTFFGYALLYYGINAIQGNSQAKFVTYVFPFGN